MTRRVERAAATFGRTLERKRRVLVPILDDQPAEGAFALRYSNGYVTVEISHDALDAYVASNGDVPLPIETDDQTGDRRAYDAHNGVRVVYAPDASIREVATRSRDGLFVRINFTGSDAAGR